MFFCEFCGISKNIFFTEHLWVTTSGVETIETISIACVFVNDLNSRFYVYVNDALHKKSNFPLSVMENLIFRAVIFQLVWDDYNRHLEAVYIYNL